MKHEEFLVTELELSKICSLKYTIDCKSQRIKIFSNGKFPF